MVRHPGRPLKPLDEALEAPVYAWAAAVRRLVFVPLMSGAGRLTLQTISERLQAMAPGETGQEPAEGAGVLYSGRGERSVQRILAGELVPTRDVVYHLLEVVAAECGALGEQDAQELWAAYKPALALAKPATFAIYELLDSYVAVRMLAQDRQRNVESLDLALEQQRVRVERADARNRRVQHAGSILRRALASSGRQTRQLRAVNEGLEQSASRMTETVAALESRLSDARGSAADWQELAAHLKEQLEHSEHIAVVSEQQRAECEALLLEWLAQACEALETAHAQSDKERAAWRWWQRQAMQAAADAHAARAEAAAQSAATLAAWEQADRVGAQARRQLTEQQAAFEEFAAQVKADHERSVRAIDHLQSQLLQAHRELRQVREDAVQADTQLASLLAEKDLLQELDAIISLALARHRAPGPPALPRFATEPPAAQASLPEPAFMDPPSQESGQPPSVEQEPEPASEPTAEAAAVRTPEPTAPDTDSGPPTAPRPAPAQAIPAAPRQQPTPAGQRRPLSVAVRGRRIAYLTIPLLCVIGLLTDNYGGSDDAARGQDTVADVGTQDVNTAAVMKLPACKDGHTTQSLRSDRTHYPPTAQPVFTFTVIGRPGMKCRINAVSTHIRLHAKAVKGGTVTWSSSACAADNPAARWIAVSHTAPATLTYRWNRAAQTACNTHTAPPGVYTVSANLQISIDHYVMASFTLLND